MVPLRSSLGIDVDFSPRFHPKPLENGGFGEVVLVLSAEKSVETHRVRQREDGCFEIDGSATLFRVDERASRGELKFDFGLGRAHLEIGQRPRRFVFFGFQQCRCLKTPFFLAFVGELLSVVEHHFIDFRPFESRENIVFVGLDEAVGRRGDVVGARERQRMLREVAWQILLFVEGIGEFAFVIGLFRVESVGDIA